MSATLSDLIYRQKRAMRLALILLGAAGLLYIAIVATAFLLQSRMIYPAPPVRGGEEAAGFTPIAYATGDGLALQAGYREARAGRPTIVFFHGNGADWQSSVPATEALAAAGYGVLAAEYRGYGGNPGRPSERGLYADGRAAIAWLRAAGVADGEMVLIGNSIGAGVAVQMATEMRPRALILISPFTSLADAAQALYRWLPARLLLRDRYDNLTKLRAIEAPVLVLHGAGDSLIPPAQARTLAAATASAELIVLPSHGHNMAWDPGVQRLQLVFLERRPP